MSMLTMYFLMQWNSIFGAIIFLAFSFSILYALITFIRSSEDEIDWEAAKKNYRVSIAAFLFGVFLTATVPSRDDLIAIYTVPKIVNTDFVKNDLPQTINDDVKDIHFILRSWIEKEKKNITHENKSENN